MSRRCTFGQLSLLLCCVTAAIIAEVVEGNKTKSWTLYHRLLAPGASSATPNSDWSIRGTVELTIVDPVPAVAEPESSVTLILSNDKNSLTEELAQALTSTNGWYQLKLTEDGKQQQSRDEIVLTSVPACHVRRANFRDEFVLQLQQNTAKVLSLTYMPLISPLAPATCDEYNQSQPFAVDSVPTFESKISWETNVPGMVVGRPPQPNNDPLQQSQPLNKVTPPPPGLKWIPGASRKPAGTGTGGGAGADPDNSPPTDTGPFAFAKRYWYILLPLMIVNLMGAGDALPPTTTSAGGGGGAPGAAVAAATAGVAVGAASRVAGGVAATTTTTANAARTAVTAATPTGAAAAAATKGSPPVRRRGKKG